MKDGQEWRHSSVCVCACVQLILRLLVTRSLQHTQKSGRWWEVGSRVAGGWSLMHFGSQNDNLCRQYLNTLKLPASWHRQNLKFSISLLQRTATAKQWAIEKCTFEIQCVTVARAQKWQKINVHLEIQSLLAQHVLFKILCHAARPKTMNKHCYFCFLYLNIFMENAKY